MAPSHPWTFDKPPYHHVQWRSTILLTETIMHLQNRVGDGRASSSYQIDHAVTRRISAYRNSGDFCCSQKARTRKNQSSLKPSWWNRASSRTQAVFVERVLVRLELSKQFREWKGERMEPSRGLDRPESCFEKCSQKPPIIQERFVTLLPE